MLLLTAALIGPYFVDWTSYRGDFEREASRVLGREVKVAGSATARLLPFPSVTFTDVRVAGTDDQPALTAETFSMDAELAPFLRGELLIFDMRLVRPKAVLHIGNDGAVDWAMRPNTPFDPGNVTIEKLTVTEGQVRIEHAASGRTHLLTEINTDVSATTIAGPWRITGSMRLDGALTDFDLSTGRLDETGGMRVRVRAKPQRYPFSIETDGTARLDLGSPKYEAGFKLTAYDEEPQLRGSDGDTFALDGQSDPSRGPPDYRMSGKLVLDHRRLAATEFVLETGPLDDPYTAEGKADIDLGGEPRFSVEATGAQFRFDDRVDQDSQAAASLERRIAAVKAFAVALPKPSIPGSVEVSLPAVVAGDTTFRDVRLSAEPAEGGWRIDELAASMPGRATLEADGFLATNDEDASFEGNMLLAVAQPSGFAAWLSRDVDDAIRRLPRAGFQAKVNLTSAKQVLDEATLQLGDARFKGRLESVTPANANPSLLVSLDGGALDLEGLAAFSSLFVTEAGRTRLGGRDLDLKVAAGPVSAGGLTTGRLETALRLKDGKLDIDRLALTDLEGTNISATGAIDGFPDKPTGNLDAAIVSDDLGPLASLIADRNPDNRLAAALAARLGGLSELGRDATINVVATGSGTGGAMRYALSAGGRMGGGQLTLAWTATGPILAPQTLDINLTAENPDGAALLALAGLPTLPIDGLGAASAEVSIKGSPSEGMKAKATLSGDTASAAFDGTVLLSGDETQAKGQARLEGSDLEPWLAAAGFALPGMGYGLPLDLDATLDLSASGLGWSGLQGTVGEVAVSGEGRATLEAGIPAISGRIETDYLPLDLSLALPLGEGTLEGDGEGWSKTAFAARANAPFTATLALKAREVGWGEATIARDAAMTAKVDREGLAISDLSAAVGAGRATGLFEVKNNDGTVALTAQATLAGINLSMLPGATAIDGKTTIAATIGGSGKSLEALVASLSGTGTARLSGLGIIGINPDALPALIAEADKAGKDIKDTTVAGFAPAIAGQGRFEGGDADLSFTLAGGVLRTSPLVLADQGTQLTAELRADLADWTVDASGEIAYAPGPEALVGSQPVLNFAASGEPGQVQLAFDPQPMAQFLTQRALEIEQARVEAMQAVLLEKQRLRREVRYYAALEQARAEAEAERLRQEEEARKKAEEEARAKAEAEAKAKAEEEARLRAEEEAGAKAEEEARRKAQAEAKAKAEAEEKARAAAEAKAKAEEEKRLKAEAEARRRAEEEAAAKAKADEDARLKAEEEARARAEAEAEKERRARLVADEALKAAQDAQAAAEAEAREKAAQRAQEPEPAPAPPAAAGVEMAGKPKPNSQVKRPPAPVQPAPKPEGGFSFDRLLKVFGAD